MAVSTVQRSLEYARKTIGWLAESTQRWQEFRKKDGETVKFRRDLFKIIDFIGLDAFGRADAHYRTFRDAKDDEAYPRLIGVQATDSRNYAAHVRPFRDEDSEKHKALLWWLHAGGTFEIWAWRKARNRWVLRRMLFLYVGSNPKHLEESPLRIINLSEPDLDF